VADGEDGETVEVMECLATAGVQNPSGSTARLVFELTGVMFKRRHLNRWIEVIYAQISHTAYNETSGIL